MSYPTRKCYVTWRAGFGAADLVRSVCETWVFVGKGELELSLRLDNILFLKHGLWIFVKYKLNYQDLIRLLVFYLG